MVGRMSVQRESSFWVVGMLFDEDETSMQVGVACACCGLATHQSDGHMPVASGLRFKLYMSAVGGR